MKARILPNEEWSAITPMLPHFPEIRRSLRDGETEMIVVEDGGKIVATMGVMRAVHFEGLWIDPEYRGNAGLGRRLIRAGIDSAKKWTDEWVWASVGDEHMDDVLVRLGGRKMPVETFILEI